MSNYLSTDVGQQWRHVESTVRWHRCTQGSLLTLYCAIFGSGTDHILLLILLFLLLFFFLLGLRCFRSNRDEIFHDCSSSK